MDKEVALRLLKDALGETEEYVPEFVSDRLLLKLSEECAELIQAICKSLNPASKQYGVATKVFEEAGHVKMFLEMLDALHGKGVTKSMKERIQRHKENPK